MLAHLRADQRRRWHQGDRVPAEAYRDREPSLRADADLFLDVIYSEVLLREELGESPCLAEYLDRFPEHGEALRLQFDLHRELAPRDGPATIGWTAGAASTSGPALPSMPGYEILGELGRGGMGVVYRAHDRAFNRLVAVKVLQDRFPADSASARRFLDEARITGQLQHPAIPPVHQMGTLPDGRPFLVMKLVKGSTLAELLAKRADPAQERGRFLSIFLQVCQGVAYAHSKDVIHRDLKPANVMVGAFGEVQVMDWGLAKVLTETVPAVEQPPPDTALPATVVQTGRDSGSLTEAGSLLGTPGYMPPEQAKGNIAGTDRRADVFALGGMLCELLTGQPPYAAPTSAEVQALALTAQLGPAFARLDACGADADLVALAKRCLSADLAARPANAEEVARAVAHLAAAQERARQTELDRVRSEAAARQRRKHRRVQLALAAAVAGLLVVAGFGAVVLTLWRQADQAKDTAETEQKNAEAALARLGRVEYGRTMQVAYDHARDGNAGATLELLRETRRDLRGWEWHYVQGLCYVERCTLKGHAARVASAAFRGDGAWIVTGSWDGTARVWDARTGIPVLPLEGHTKRVVSAAFSPDGWRIVIGGWDQTATVWDTQTGAPLHTLPGHTAEVQSVCFSPDGSRIVTTSEDHTARVWDATSGKEILRFDKHTGAVGAASFRRDGTQIVTASGDRTAKVWDARTGRVLLTLTGHSGGVSCASFNPDGSRIVTGGMDHRVKVWDARTGLEVLTLKGHTGDVWSASFSPDGSRLVTSSLDGTAKVWDAGPRRSPEADRP